MEFMESYLAYKENILKELSETYKNLIFKFLIENININISVLFVYGSSQDIEKNDIWEKISQVVALKYQSKITDVVDKWNIYIIFICQDIASKELKNKIENNRFSNRKIVEDNFLGEFNDLNAKALIVKHITNTDLIEVIADTNDIIQQDYLPISKSLWDLMPKDESISGRTIIQKGLIDLLKKIGDEN
ncbi:hypothetical protein MWU76_15725 [Gelidibacter sp. F2691]|nr:hypothetical protein [Gelidibacter sp. F2691]